MGFCYLSLNACPSIVYRKQSKRVVGNREKQPNHDLVVGNDDNMDVMKFRSWCTKYAQRCLVSQPAHKGRDEAN